MDWLLVDRPQALCREDGSSRIPGIGLWVGDAARSVALMLLVVQPSATLSSTEAARGGSARRLQ